jgi:ABC-type uncharacterized transport system substrate-binding protein
MTFRLFGFLFALCTSLALAGTPANAHPHVWVKVNSELVYAPDGTVTGVRHVWTFDDMFSTYAVQGIEAKQKGVFTREELAPVAEENVSSMKELEYFTFAKADGKKTKFRDPVDYWLEFKDEMLTLHFFLPLEAPAKAASLNLEVFDPEFFIDFELAESDPVKLAGAPSACKLAVTRRPDPSAPLQGQRLSEAMFKQQASYGAMYANKIAVSCP